MTEVSATKKKIWLAVKTSKVFDVRVSSAFMNNRG